MKRCLILLALFASACTSTGTTTDSGTARSTPQPAQQPVKANNSENAAVARNGLPVAVAAQAPGTVIPKGARFTIFCESFTGDDHVQRSTEMKAVLMKNAVLKGWYVIHKEGQSTIYQGYYSEFDVANAKDTAAKKEAQRAQSEKKLVEALPIPKELFGSRQTSDAERRLFPRALFVSLDSPDPDAPDEWNLVKTRGYWSVEIAAYSGFERKQAAVESVREARKMNIPAYYYHGPSYSSVCIGAWPQTAVIEKSTEQVNSIPQGSDVFVDVQGGAIPQQMKNDLLNKGRQVQVVVPKVQIVDQSLLDTLRAYPEHSVDGFVEMDSATDPQTKELKQKAKHSMLVRIPAADNISQVEGADDGHTPTLIQPTPSNNNLGTRLRGLNP